MTILVGYWLIFGNDIFYEDKTPAVAVQTQMYHLQFKWEMIF